MAGEAYEGSANRETWAFLLRINNSQPMQQQTLAVAATALAITPDTIDVVLGDLVVRYWQDEVRRSVKFALSTGDDRWEGRDAYDFEREVGSWWRIDHAEVGANLRATLADQ